MLICSYIVLAYCMIKVNAFRKSPDYVRQNTELKNKYTLNEVQKPYVFNNLFHEMLSLYLHKIPPPFFLLFMLKAQLISNMNAVRICVFSAFY